MSDPERDLAAKVREHIWRQFGRHDGTPCSCGNPHVMDEQLAALDSLLALAVDRERLLRRVKKVLGTNRPLGFGTQVALIELIDAALAHTDEGGPTTPTYDHMNAHVHGDGTIAYEAPHTDEGSPEP